MNQEERNAWQREYRRKHPEKFKAYEEKRKDHKKTIDAIRYQRNLEKNRERSLCYAREHREKRRETSKAYRERIKLLPEIEKEKIREKNRQRVKRYLARPEKLEHHIEYHKKYRRENRKKLVETANRWRDNNREHFRHIQRRRESRVRGAKGNHSYEEWKLLLDKYNHKCIYCRRGNIRLERDHLIPIFCGGSDFIENIAPACRSCNSSKGTKTAEEFWQITNKHQRKEV